MEKKGNLHDYASKSFLNIGIKVDMGVLKFLIFSFKDFDKSCSSTKIKNDKITGNNHN
jgi:hypothetical protein